MLSMSTATEMRQKYIEADAAVLLGQQVRFGERFLSRADLAEIRAGRHEWQRRVDNELRLLKGGASPRYQTPYFR
jgi:hypothetical protein